MDDQSNHPIIFVVDENDDDSLILYQDLKDQGLEIDLRIFTSVKELIKSHNKLKSSILQRIILIDGFLKQDTIRNAVSAIKSIPEFEKVPIFVMIGAKYEKEYFKAFKLDVSGYVVKPINIKSLERYLKLRWKAK